MVVECINDSGKPSDIPTSMWIKKGNAYTVIDVFEDMNDVLLFVLEEIDLASLGTPYKGFASYRFAPMHDIDGLLEELELELENN
jgi:hypothetical protein